MSEYRFYIGDAEVPMNGATMELNIESAPFRYPGGVSEASATFEITDPAWDYVKDWALTDRRTLQITSEVPLVWSRWRRWLNAVLRFAWWPIGPPSLPTMEGVSIEVPDMRVERISGGRGEPLVVEMSNRPDA